MASSALFSSLGWHNLVGISTLGQVSWKWVLSARSAFQRGAEKYLADHRIDIQTPLSKSMKDNRNPKLLACMRNAR